MNWTIFLLSLILLPVAGLMVLDILVALPKIGEEIRGPRHSTYSGAIFIFLIVSGATLLGMCW